MQQGSRHSCRSVRRPAAALQRREERGRRSPGEEPAATSCAIEVICLCRPGRSVRTGGERRLGDYLGGEVREDGGSGGGVRTGPHPRCAAESAS